MTPEEKEKLMLDYLSNANSQMLEDKAEREKYLEQKPTELKQLQQHYKLELFLTADSINKVLNFVENLK